MFIIISDRLNLNENSCLQHERCSCSLFFKWKQNSIMSLYRCGLVQVSVNVKMLCISRVGKHTNRISNYLEFSPFMTIPHIHI